MKVQEGNKYFKVKIGKTNKRAGRVRYQFHHLEMSLQPKNT